MEPRLSSAELNEATDLLRAMVAIPSVNPRDQSLPAEEKMAEFIRGWLDGRGVHVTREEAAIGRPNIIGTVSGRGAHRRAVLLESHMDTVATDGMTIDPFAGEVRTGRLYGRGSCDAKGSLAAFMLAIVRLAARSHDCPIDVCLAAVSGEEYGGVGVKHLVTNGRPWSAALVGEPTGLRAVVASKGVMGFWIEVRGHAAHSSSPRQGDNAIERMAEVVLYLREHAATIAEEDGHPLVGPRTQASTLVQGGSGTNVIPHQCMLYLSRRLLPGEDPQKLWEQYNALLRARWGGKVVALPVEAMAPPTETDPQTPFVRSLLRTLSEAGLNDEPTGVGFSCDASILAGAELPTVIFGPGSISDAHQPDESVDIGEVATAARIVEKLILKLDPEELSPLFARSSSS
jgi:acetylornithine deacetylase